MKNRTLKIMLGTGCIIIGILAGVSSGPAIIFLPLLVIGVILIVSSLWVILTGLPKALFVAGTFLGIIGLIIAYFGDSELECTGGIIIGLGILIGGIAIIAGYSDIEDVTGWDRDL